MITCIYVPVSLVVPFFCSRFGITRCVCPIRPIHPSAHFVQAQIGTFLALISGWVRYAGTSTALSPQSAYALLMFGQVMLVHSHF